jgi:two-component system OmpR family response regulator
MMRQPGQVMTRQALIERVWDAAFDCDSNVVDVYVGYLRAKIDRPFGRRSVQTVRGAGYVVRADPEHG